MHRSQAPWTVPAPILVVSGIFSLQIGAAIARQHFGTVGPLGATLLRLLISAALLAVLLRPRPWTWPREKWVPVIVLGVALGGMNQLIYLAIDRIPVGVAVTVEYLGPLILSLLHVRRLRESIWSLCALGGVVLLGMQAVTSLDLLGVAFAAIGGGCWVAYILAGARLGRGPADASSLAVSMAIGSLLAVPLGFHGATKALDQPRLLAIFTLVAILSSVVPYLIELWALRTMPARVFSVIQSFGPAAGALAGLVMLGQRLVWQEVAALLLVTIASVGVTVTARRPPLVTEGPA
ncbi:MAG: EamA family transporter [Thermomicrobiales bacterium]